MANEVIIGTTTPQSLENLENAINDEETAEGSRFGTGTVAHPLVSASHDGNVLYVTARDAGTGGNSIATATDLAGAGWKGPTLSDGADGVFENCNGSFVFEDSGLAPEKNDAT